MVGRSAKISELVRSGDSSFHKGKYDKAVSHYSNAIRQLGRGAQSYASRLLLADAYNGMGHTVRSKGWFKKAYSFQNKALALYRELAKHGRNIDKRMALSLHYMGDVLADLNQMDRALGFSRAELKLARRLYSKDEGNLRYLVYGLNVTAGRLADKKEFRGAVSLLNESLKAQNGFGRPDAEKNYPNLSWTYHILGTTLLDSGDAEQAIINLKKALAMRIAIADKNVRYIGALRNTLEALSLAYSKKNTTSAKSKRGYL